MSKIEAKVCDISNGGNLNIVTFDINGLALEMVSLELNNLHIGDEVVLDINPSHVALSKNLDIKSSHPNQLSSKVIKIDKGVLLSIATIEISQNIVIEALLTTKSLSSLLLNINDQVIALINASEISISRKIS